MCRPAADTGSDHAAAFAPAAGARAIPLATSSAATNNRWIVRMTSPLSRRVLRTKPYPDEVH